MTLKDLLATAWKKAESENPGVSWKSQDFRLALARNAMQINGNEGSPVDVKDIAEAVQGISRYRGPYLEGFGKALWNEAKHQGAELVNTAADVVTLGQADLLGIPRVDAGPNPNDQNISDGMKTFRSAATTVGHTAASMAAPGAAVKGLKYVANASRALKSTAAIKLLRDPAAVLSKAPMEFKAGQRLKATGDWLLKNVVFDTYSNLPVTSPKQYIVPIVINGGMATLLGSPMHERQMNTGRFYEGQLTSDQWAMLGLTPEQGSDLVNRYGSDWHKHINVSPDIVDAVKTEGTYYPKPSKNTKSNPVNTNNNNNPEKDTPWYHHAAVGYGGGALAGGATGYLLSTLMNGDKATRVMSTIGGGLVGSVLGRVIQERLSKS